MIDKQGEEMRQVEKDKGEKKGGREVEQEQADGRVRGTVTC